MTNKEAVIASIQITGYSDSAIDKALLDAGIEGSVNYNSANKKPIDLVAIEVLQGMRALSSVTEGGYSVSYSLAGIEARLGYLNALYGITGQPKVRAVKMW
jgi:hypothetical protein